MWVPRYPDSHMNLTDSSTRAAKPKAKPYKLPHENGLFLIVNPNGSKWWRLSYYVSGEGKMLSLDDYPDVTSATARQPRNTARGLVANGVDPSAKRQD